tara:strand:+ start:117 stop:593 length:477 start_codon:yes stop_codon:yes gene_type:complete
MRKTPCGRFCDVCRKEVVDFRGKPVDEIYQFQKSINDDVCGVFSPEQLDPNLIPIKKLIPNRAKLRFAASFTVLGLGVNSLDAQSCDEKKHAVEQTDSVKSNELSEKEIRKKESDEAKRRKRRRRNDGWNYVETDYYRYFITYKWPFFTEKLLILRDV